MSKPTPCAPWTALLGASFLLAVLPACDSNGGQAQQTPPDAPPPQEAPVNLAEMGYDEGDMEESVIWVVEFSDFGCVHCARFHAETYPEIYQEFVAAGDVAWKYIPITIAGFPNAEEAAVTAHCAADQGRFAEMRDHLYEQREEWFGAQGADGLFHGYARDVGLDADDFAACYVGDGARERLSEGNRVAAQIGIQGTPTFIVQGFPVQGAPPLEQFQEALRGMVAEAREPGES